MPSPQPAELLDLPSIRMLIAAGTLTVCSGGGGIPVARDPAGTLYGVEAVVDKDLTAALLAQALNADVQLLLTDVAEVQDGSGTPAAHPIHQATPASLRSLSFPAGSMGPKIEAACRFVEATGKMAAIGRLTEAAALLDRKAGTIITACFSRVPGNFRCPLAPCGQARPLTAGSPLAPPVVAALFRSAFARTPRTQSSSPA